MKTIELTNGGIGIYDGHRADLSANTHKGMIEIAIGEDFTNRDGYKRYLEFHLSKEEATAFVEWLAIAIARLHQESGS